MHAVPYIPAHYQRTTTDRCVFWGRDGSEPAAMSLLDDCLRRLETLLDHRLQRTLHLVVYATNADARAALGRDIPPEMLLAPFHSRDAALVAIQSPAADPSNGDEHRMRRHLCHELAHVFAAERTGSTKELGDAGIHMRLLPWVDEGFAEVLAARATGRLEIIAAAAQRCSNANLADAALNAAFMDLASPDRANAFACATTRVARMVERRGLRFVFERLHDPDGWHDEVLDREDVPPGVDFHDAAQARTWTEETPRKRPWRARFFSEYCNALRGARLRILELGSGPGHLAREILTHCDVAEYIALDFAAPMHALARAHLGDLTPRVRFELRDFRLPTWTNGLAELDAIVTLQAVHETRHKRRARPLFAQARAVLRPGGQLLYCDHYATATSRPNLALGRDEQASALREAGFASVELLLDEGGMALYRARD